jgi:hypothetical protein
LLWVVERRWLRPVGKGSFDFGPDDGAEHGGDYGQDDDLRHAGFELAYAPPKAAAFSAIGNRSI